MEHTEFERLAHILRSRAKQIGLSFFKEEEAAEDEVSDNKAEDEEDKEDKEVKDGMKFLNDADCSWDKPAECPLYAWYYLSQAKFHVGGNTWSSWNNKFAPLYIRHQNPDGSWLSPGVTGFKEGKDTVEREWMGSDIDSKVYATTLAALTLQVYYRFLPTYKPIETATEEASDGDVEIEIL